MARYKAGCKIPCLSSLESPPPAHDYYQNEHRDLFQHNVTHTILKRTFLLREFQVPTIISLFLYSAVIGNFGGAELPTPITPHSNLDCSILRIKCSQP